MGNAKRVIRRIRRSIMDSADLFRRRRTETPRLVGWIKKNQVVVGPVWKETQNGKDMFKAEFVRPRAGSQLAPFSKNHQIVLAAEAAAHQVAIASMKKFGKANGKTMLVVKNSFTWRKKIPPKPQMIVQVTVKNETRLLGKNYKVFECTFTDKNQKTRYATGEITILVQDKAQNH